jgi:hypothetical protein
MVAIVLAWGSVDAASAASAVLKTGLPNHTLTPGYLNPAVTQATIKRTICIPGWTAKIRPPSSYTTPLKIKQLALYGYADRNTAHYEEDHLVSLELGGSPKDPRNLWPEPYHIKVGKIDVGSYAKDQLENDLKAAVCAGRITLAHAQYEEKANWVAYWHIDLHK